MKDLMKKYRPVVMEINNQNLSEFHGRTLLVKFSLYQGLSMMQLALNEDRDPVEHYKDYTLAAARVLYHYLSLASNQFTSRATFVSSFYQTYETFPLDLVLSSEYETSSIFYDASLESSLARMFAIGKKLNSEFLNDVSSLLDSLLALL